MSEKRKPTAVEMEIADRAERLLRSSGARRSDQAEIQVKSVTISQGYNEPSDTTIVVVRDEDFRLLKIFDGEIYIQYAEDPIVHFVLEILRDYMILDDLADV